MQIDIMDYIRELCAKEAIEEEGKITNLSWLVMKTEEEYPNTDWNVTDLVITVANEITGSDFFTVAGM